MTTTNQKYTLSDNNKKIYKNVPIHHIYNNDKYTDLPLLIECENGKKAIVPVFKRGMRCFAPVCFKVFYDQNSNFKEKYHQDGEIYPITIPELNDPAFVAKYIKALQSVDLEKLTACKSQILKLNIDNCFEYFSISKYWGHDSVSKNIIKFVEKEQLFEMVPKHTCDSSCVKTS